MPSGSEQPQQVVPVEAVFDGRTEDGHDPFREVLKEAVKIGFEPIVEKARRKREERESVLAAKIEEALALP